MRRITPAILRLRLELLASRVMLWVANTGRDNELQPETHLYLADLHFRMAAAYEAVRNRKLARHHKAIANRHASAGPPAPLPPAAAMAMPVPQPFVFTDARGRVVEAGDPDHVA